MTKAIFRLPNDVHYVDMYDYGNDSYSNNYDDYGDVGDTVTYNELVMDINNGRVSLTVIPSSKEELPAKITVDTDEDDYGRPDRNNHVIIIGDDSTGAKQAIIDQLVHDRILLPQGITKVIGGISYLTYEINNCMKLQTV